MTTNTSPPSTEGTADDAQETETYQVFGWAELGPSGELEVPANRSINSVLQSGKYEVLRDDLRDRGFTDEQIEKMHLELDYVE